MLIFSKSINRKRDDVPKALPAHARREVPGKEPIAGISEYRNSMYFVAKVSAGKARNSTPDSGAPSGHGVKKRITQGEPWARIWSPFRGRDLGLSPDGARNFSPGFSLGGGQNVGLQPCKGKRSEECDRGVERF